MNTLLLCFFSFAVWLFPGLTKAYTTPENIQLAEGYESRKLEPIFLKPRVLDENEDVTDFKCTKYSTCYTEMIESQSYTFQMEPRTKLSVTLNLKRVKGDVAISYKSDNQALQIRREIHLSASKYKLKLLSASIENEWELTITKEDLEAYSQLVFSEINLSKSMITATISLVFELKELEDSSSLSSDDSSYSPSIVIIVVSIFGGIFLILFSLGFYCGIKRRRQRRNSEAALRARREIIANYVASYLSKNLVNVVNKSPIKDPLTPENLDERFPETKSEELKTSFPQSTCSICLEELQNGKMCRQLYCEHMFHSECVKIWLNNQLLKGMASCPNCKKSVMELSSNVLKQ